MSDHADRIAKLEAELATLRAEVSTDPAPEQEQEPDLDGPDVPEVERNADGMPAGRAALHEEFAEPEPGAVYYGTSLHPDDASASVLAGGHAVGGHAGLGAGTSN